MSNADATESVAPGSSGTHAQVTLPKKVYKDWLPFDNTYHPGLKISDLEHTVHGFDVQDLVPDKDKTACWQNWKPLEPGQGPLCHNCGWHDQLNLFRGYTSRLKIFLSRDNQALWELGPNWILRDEANYATNKMAEDYNTQEFLRKEGAKIPLVSMQRFGAPEDKFHFTIMSRAKGVPLAEIWDQLNFEQTAALAQELKGYLKEIRRFNRPRIEMVDGQAVPDLIIAKCGGFLGRCMRMGVSEELWLEKLTPELRKAIIFQKYFNHFYEPGHPNADMDSIPDSWIQEADEKLNEFKSKFPKDEGPYVLTHQDLQPPNIIVSDELETGKYKISAIIDWEYAGFLPWWVQGFRLSLCEEMGYDWMRPDLPDGGTKRMKDIFDFLEPMAETWSFGDGQGLFRHEPASVNVWTRSRSPYGYKWPTVGYETYDDTNFGMEAKHLPLYNLDTEKDEDELEGLFVFCRLWNELVQRHPRLIQVENVELKNADSQDRDLLEDLKAEETKGTNDTKGAQGEGIEERKLKKLKTKDM
ncbi:hypothetical protein B0J14DRAFT_684798 [Halenospora varia]|nr:hypothetical protein B0J14DRAFT_684798 [Halenospora varia]